MSRQNHVQQRRAPWQNAERHYCAVCNSWMGSDKQSILLHENGKKHIQNVERSLLLKRKQKQDEMKAQSFLVDSLQQMEAAAAAAAATSSSSMTTTAAAAAAATTTTTLHAPGPVLSSSWQAQPQQQHRHHRSHHPPPPPPPPPQQQPWQQQYGVPQMTPSTSSLSSFHPVPSPEPSSVISTTTTAALRPIQSRPPSRLYNNNNNNNDINDDRQQRQEWEERKRQRDQDNKMKKARINGMDDGSDEYNDDDDEKKGMTAGGIVKTKRRRIDPNEGYYEIPSEFVGTNPKKGDGDNKDVTTTTTTTTTFLEGDIFYGILEDDMPVQLWTGPVLATREEKRLLDRTYLWKNAVILSVHPKTIQSTSDDDSGSRNKKDGPEGNVDVDAWTVHVAYLKTPNDDVETVEKHVPVNRIRIRLGSNDDERIPETLEEARLLAMGGIEEKFIVNHNSNIKKSTTAATTDNRSEQQRGRQKQLDVEEATGLSAWTTVSIRTTTIRQQDREERERLAEQRRMARIEQEAEAKRAEARKMEEAKVSNADDSALGAYDVWGRGDYKGIDISREVTLNVEDTAKKLSTSTTGGGSSNGAGKATFRKAKNRAGGAASRRRTSADDD